MAGKGSAPGERRGGRKAGTANKVTAKAREAIATFVDGNASRLTAWLDAIAEENPKDAFNCFMSVVEYHIPKLARTESVIDANVKVETLTKEQKDAAVAAFTQLNGS